MNTATTGVASSARTVTQGGHVFSFRDGRICAHDAYYTLGNAIEAVGLDEYAVRCRCPV